ncbi:MAG: Rrf2 family transcriptional regulator [candidate division Zixibacteria bacterium]|nr:Rrf2 family transcriptional regulator [candidate division Zixibacteria bacterium]
MQISRKALYAIKAIIYLSAKKGKRLCTITEIAEKENIPREYMAKILKELTQKGYLSSYRGVQGGYRLNKARSEISFLDILEAVQGQFDSPSKTGTSEEAKLYQGASFDFWADLHEVAGGKLAKMTMNKIDYNQFYPDDK